MGNPRRRLLVAFAVSVALGGCAHRATCPTGARPQTTLPVTQRTSVEANIRSSAKTDATSPEPTPSYRALTPNECQCMAVNTAAGATLHTQEAELAERSRHNLLKGDAGPKLRRDVLVYTSLELQNRAAGTALETYYHIAEAEGKSEIVDLALVQLSDAVSETRRMTTQKLKPPVGLDVWERQLSTSQGDKLQTQLTIDQLNSELRGLLRPSDGCERWRVWNPEAYEVADTAIDVEAAVCDGLARRPELLMLRLLSRDLTPATLPEVRDAVRAIQPMLGAMKCPVISAKLPALLAFDLAARNELEVRRRQIEEYTHERENAVAEDIREAASSLRYRAKIAALAMERERSWQERVRDAKSRQQQGLSSFAEVAQTNLDWLKARADVVQEVMAWEIARVKLKQAQGLLVAECAYGQTACGSAPSRR